MQTYDIGLVPGPVSVPPELRAAYQINYGSSDLEDEFFALYRRCESHLGKILATRNRVAIQSGEGMIALWSALKSVLRSGDRVLAVANGVFGYGIGDMARQLGMEVEVVDFGYDDIHYSQKIGGQWTPAKNIGSIVNTYTYDFSPKISPDGKTLYFSSRINQDYNSKDSTYTFKTFDAQLKSPLNGFGNIYKIELSELSLSNE